MTAAIWGAVATVVAALLTSAGGIVVAVVASGGRTRDELAGLRTEVAGVRESLGRLVTVDDCTARHDQEGLRTGAALADLDKRVAVLEDRTRWEG
jgi:hypothetical protein